MTGHFFIKHTPRGPCGTKVLRLGMCRSIMFFSKITQQMCCDHPLSQRNKATKRAGGIGVSMCVGGGGLAEISKKRREASNKGQVFIK